MSYGSTPEGLCTSQCLGSLTTIKSCKERWYSESYATLLLPTHGKAFSDPSTVYFLLLDHTCPPHWRRFIFLILCASCHVFTCRGRWSRRPDLRSVSGSKEYSRHHSREGFFFPPFSNYGIILHRSVYRPLLPVLQMYEASFLEKCSIGIPRAQMISETTTTTFHCHRGRLESILRKGLDIIWEQSLQSVEIGPQRISLHVENGPMIKSDALIGADGIYSLLRKSIIPNSKLNVLPYVVFNGRRSVTLEDYQHELQPHMAGKTII